MKKLTIGIPTYNRLDSLMQTVNSILPQIKGYEDFVDIFISDNHSTDNTLEYLQNLCKNNKNVTFDELPENRGPDGNFLNILKKSNSEYIHILSDDDILIDGALLRVLEIIRKDEFGLLFLNSCVFYKKFDKNNLNQYSQTYIIDHDIATSSKKEFINIVHLEFTFLSSLIFNKRCFDLLKEPERFLHTNWFQSYVALYCTTINKNIAIIKDVCIAQKQLTTSPSFNPFLVFGPNLYKLIEYAISLGYDRKILKKLYYKRCHTMYRSIGKYKIDRKNVFKDFKPMFMCTKHKISFWFTLYPFLFIPRFIYQILGKSYYNNQK